MIARADAIRGLADACSGPLVKARPALRAGVAEAISVFDAVGLGIYCVDPHGFLTYVNPEAAALLGWAPEELVGRHACDVIHRCRSDGSPHPCAECPFSAAPLADGVAAGPDEVFWTRDGAAVPVANRIARLHEDGVYAGAVVVFAGVSERRRETELLRVRAAQQAAVAGLGLAALGGGALQALLEQASVLVAETLEVELTAVLELLADEDGLGLRAGVGWREGAVCTATLGLDRGSLAGFGLAHDEPVVVDDFRTETRFRTPALMLEHDVVCGVSVVVHGRDRPWGTAPWGTVGAYSRRHRTFTPDDVNFLHTVANTLGLAIERMDAEDELRRRNREITELAEQVTKLAEDRRRIMADVLDAEDRTRARISQLLHDEVLQSLLSARQDLAKAGRAPSADDSVTRAREGVVAAIGELRHAVAALHPVTLERRGLPSAIEATAALHAAGAGFDVSVEIAAETAGALDQLIHSLAQELLNNVAQHAAAEHVTVTLRRARDDFVFEVADDGRGMDPGRPGRALSEGHIGLASVRRRVESLGGRFELESAPGDGTRVRVLLPAASL